MESRRFFLHLRYKGTNYFGWQSQPNQRSIQEEIESALTKIHSNNEVKITGCGRTDTGVHATNYYAHFDSNTIADPEECKSKLNAMLDDDIAILDLIKVSADAHARFDATARTYHYFIHRQKDPFLEDRSWLYRAELNLELMNKACLMLQNHIDFECFSKVKTDVTNFNCDIRHALWMTSEQGYIFTITANRFLRNMVRAIVGTMLEIGLEKISLDDFENILNSQDRGEAGQSVPAKGLFLADIEYPYIQNT